MKIKFGVTIDAAPEMLFKADYATINKMAVQCERLGYYSLWVMDHLTWGRGGEGAVFEAWTLLSALATEIKKMRLGTMVACNSFRNPALTAKIAATLDVISNGRVILGYGAGWKRDEYEAYGFPFPKPSVRVRQMREGVAIIKKLWTGETASFEGAFYNIKDAVCRPKPIQKPHPPIIIGGGGEKYTLKASAELGDGWNIWDAPLERYKRKVDILTRYCDELGRSIEDLELSWSGNLILAEEKRELNRKIEAHKTQRRLVTWHDGIITTYDDCVERLQRYIDLGCTHFIFSLATFNSEKEAFINRIASSF